MNSRNSWLLAWVILQGISPSVCMSEEGRSITGHSDETSLNVKEQRVRVGIEKSLPSVVAVAVQEKAQGKKKSRQRFLGSGVIVTEDGLVLSQFHVTHMLDKTDLTRIRKSGENATVILRDGQECEAELLGADRTYDISLLRLVKPKRPFPFTSLIETVAPKIGDSVLKLGHASGYQSGRPPVVRLGRVLYAQPELFVADCLVSGGDSGGPYFDVDGRLAGIIHDGSIPRRMQEQRSSRVGTLASVVTNSLITSFLPSMLQKEVSTADGRQVFERLERADEVLARESWSQGTNVKETYREVVKAARASVVAVRDANEVVALGTIVEAEGLIVTKASVLPAEPRCELPDGQILAANVVGMEPTFDIAMLKVAVTNLQPAHWSDQLLSASGMFLAVPGLQELPLAIGVVSAPTRDVKGQFSTKVIPPAKEPATLPEVIGSAVQGRGYWVEFVEGQAAKAGIQPGDVLLTIAGRAVRGHQDLADCVEGHLAGDAVTVQLLRAGKPFDVTLRLRSESRPTFSVRTPVFPTVFEHDTPLIASECGGPVVDLTGNVVGINIARIDDHGCIGIPAGPIQRLLPDLKSGKYATNWIAYRKAIADRDAVMPAPATIQDIEPVTTTLDEIKEQLAHRRKLFKSLLVEYETVSEAHVDPRLLPAWQLHSVRDYQEFHRVGFSGAKQLWYSVQPRVRMFYAPLDQINPDPNSPESVSKSLKLSKQAALSEKTEGSVLHLFSCSPKEEVSQFLFDGSKCFHWEASRNRMTPAPNASWFRSPGDYLAGLGLRPIDPQPDVAMQKAQQQYSFPENFALYEKCRVVPHYQTVDGALCLVVEAVRHFDSNGKRVEQIDRLWLDSKLGMAPRKWEQRKDGVLSNVRANSTFEEFVPGCWLPWKSSWTICAPAWASPELRNQSAYSYHMTLRKAQVNNVSDDQFHAH